MRFRIPLPVLTLAILSIAFRAHAGECDDPKSSEQIAQCLGKDLRDSDEKINSSYKELISTLNESDKANLRTAQRAWIKDRDSTCQLNTKESNREKWYDALLKDYAKTVCVTRYTRQRTKELDVLLAKSASLKNGASSRANPVLPTPTAPPASSNSDVVYDKQPPTAHN